MALKTKLTFGLGFLFLIIFGLSFFYSFHIQKLSSESNNILKDNYVSIVYSKDMLLALDDMRTAVSDSLFNANKSADYFSKLFVSGKAKFEENLKAESNNITEIHEAEYVDQLKKNYDIYLKLCGQIQSGSGSATMYFNEALPAYEKVQDAIISIFDVNMQAIERKNNLTRGDAASMVHITAIIATICILLAIAYIWYFPFYVSNTLSYLSGRMKDLLKRANVSAEFKTEDETAIILQSINLLENKFGSENK